MRSWVQALFWTSLAAVIALAVWQHSQLPARVATHFDFAGRPNGWMARDTQLKAQLGLVLGVAALMQGLAWLIDRMPVELINVPNRDYWFSDERRAESLAWVRRMVLLIGCGLFGQFGVLFYQVYRVNLAAEPRLAGRVWLLPAVVGALAVILIVAVMRRFRRPAGE